MEGYKEKMASVNDIWEHTQLTNDADIVKAINEGKADSYAQSIEFTIQKRIRRLEELLRAIRGRNIGSEHMALMESCIEEENNEHEYLYRASDGRIVRAV